MSKPLLGISEKDLTKLLAFIAVILFLLALSIAVLLKYTKLISIWISFFLLVFLTSSPIALWRYFLNWVSVIFLIRFPFCAIETIPVSSLMTRQMASEPVVIPIAARCLEPSVIPLIVSASANGNCTLVEVMRSPLIMIAIS